MVIFISHIFVKLSGGALKNKPDGESLQAKWLATDIIRKHGTKEYPLRLGDTSNFEC